jgi:peptidoglycan/xylan/chitin deacetylase (PgdA/CDA1 family)
MLNDFDEETNPASKPPFQLDRNTRFFSLIYAKKLFGTAIAKKSRKSISSSGHSLQPVSRKFGFDRGIPIDRYYIERFLNKYRLDIRGRVLEIADNTYTAKYGLAVTQSDVLHVEPRANVTLVGDLETGANIPKSVFDCIILTQTLNVVFDLKSLLKNAAGALKSGGTLLITAPGISQISRYDMDRWGDYWRFTDKSLSLMISEAIPEGDIKVEAFGNVAVAKAFLDGRAYQELDPQTLEYQDADYQVLLAARVQKPAVQHILPPKKPKRSLLNAKIKTPMILLYHRIAHDPIDSQLLAVSPENFEEHLRILTNSYRVISLHELFQEIRNGLLSPETLALTFDDGYLDNLTHALPLLEKQKLPATIFVTSGMLGSVQEFWWDSLEKIFWGNNFLPGELSINYRNDTKTWSIDSNKARLKAFEELCEILKGEPTERIQQQIEKLFEWAGISNAVRDSHKVLSVMQLKTLASSSVIDIGSHSVSHSRLSLLPINQQRKEIIESKQKLESIINKPVRFFSYPFGTQIDFTHATAKIVAEAGYEAGIANIQANVYRPANIYSIPRRLVRNWPGVTFSSWLSENRKEELEAETVRQKKRMLVNGIFPYAPDLPVNRPQVLLWTLWSSGTHWMADMLSEMLGTSWGYQSEDSNYRKETIRQLYSSHRKILVRHICMPPDELFCHTHALNIKVILLYRDIRDVIASQVNMRKFKEGFREGLPRFPEMKIGQILDWELDKYGDFYRLELPLWVKTEHNNLLKIKYEDLLNDTVRTLTCVANFLNLDLTNSKLSQIVQKNDFKARSNRPKGVEDKMAHNRKGIIGDYRNQFTLKEQNQLLQHLGRALATMGYV